MFINKYALAVEIEYGIFEIFDILHFEKNTKADLRYKKGTSFNAIAIHTTIKHGIKIGATLDNNKLVNDSIEDTISISEDENAYLFLSNNKVFGFTINKKTDPADKKYQAAFDSSVILIDISSENNVGFGDIWDGKKIINVV